MQLKYLLIQMFMLSYLVSVKGGVVPEEPNTGESWPIPKTELKGNNVFLISPNLEFDITANDSTHDILIRVKSRFLQQLTTLRARSNNVTKSKYAGEIKLLKICIEECCDTTPHSKMAEDYKLRIKYTILIDSMNIWGVIRALDTLITLFYIDKDQMLVINENTIDDAPKFKHRGLMIDTDSRFIPIDEIMNMLDAMAMNKMNVLHWRIAGDTSFPYESKNLPKLSQLGALDNTKVYNKSSIKRVIEFAAIRGIRVIPEFDIPGHIASIAKSYPEMVTTCFIEGKSGGPLDPSRESTFEVLKQLMVEVQEDFIDDYIHIGGVDVGEDCWASNSYIQKYIKDNNIYLDLHLEFIQRFFNKGIIKRDKKIIVAQDILKNDCLMTDHILPINTIIQAYNESLYKKLIASNHRAVVLSWPWNLASMTNKDDFLISMYEEAEELKNVQHFITGVEVLSTKFEADTNVFDRLWPLVCVVADVLWHGLDDTNDFSDPTAMDYIRKRIKQQTHRLAFFRSFETCFDGPLNNENATEKPDKWGLDASIKNKEAEIAYVQDLSAFPASKSRLCRDMKCDETSGNIDKADIIKEFSPTTTLPSTLLTDTKYSSSFTYRSYPQIEVNFSETDYTEDTSKTTPQSIPFTNRNFNSSLIYHNDLQVGVNIDEAEYIQDYFPTTRLQSKSLRKFNTSLIYRHDDQDETEYMQDSFATERPESQSVTSRKLNSSLMYRKDPQNSLNIDGVEYKGDYSSMPRQKLRSLNSRTLNFSLMFHNDPQNSIQIDEDEYKEDYSSMPRPHVRSITNRKFNSSLMYHNDAQNSGSINAAKYKEDHSSISRSQLRSITNKKINSSLMYRKDPKNSFNIDKAEYKQDYSSIPRPQLRSITNKKINSSLMYRKDPKNSFNIDKAEYKQDYSSIPRPQLKTLTNRKFNSSLIYRHDTEHDTRYSSVTVSKPSRSFMGRKFNSSLMYRNDFKNSVNIEEAEYKQDYSPMPRPPSRSVTNRKFNSSLMYRHDDQRHVNINQKAHQMAHLIQTTLAAYNQEVNEFIEASTSKSNSQKPIIISSLNSHERKRQENIDIKLAIMVPILPMPFDTNDRHVNETTTKKACKSKHKSGSSSNSKSKSGSRGNIKHNYNKVSIHKHSKQKTYSTSAPFHIKLDFQNDKHPPKRKHKSSRKTGSKSNSRNSSPHHRTDPHIQGDSMNGFNLNINLDPLLYSPHRAQNDARIKVQGHEMAYDIPMPTNTYDHGVEKPVANVEHKPKSEIFNSSLVYHPEHNQKRVHIEQQRHQLGHFVSGYDHKVHATHSHNHKIGNETIENGEYKSKYINEIFNSSLVHHPDHQNRVDNMKQRNQMDHFIPTSNSAYDLKNNKPIEKEEPKSNYINRIINSFLSSYPDLNQNRVNSKEQNNKYINVKLNSSLLDNHENTEDFRYKIAHFSPKPTDANDRNVSEPIINEENKCQILDDKFNLAVSDTPKPIQNYIKTKVQEHTMIQNIPTSTVVYNKPLKIEDHKPKSFNWILDSFLLHNPDTIHSNVKTEEQGRKMVHFTPLSLAEHKNGPSYTRFPFNLNARDSVQSLKYNSDHDHDKNLFTSAQNSASEHEVYESNEDKKSPSKLFKSGYIPTAVPTWSVLSGTTKELSHLPIIPVSIKYQPSQDQKNSNGRMSSRWHLRLD